MLAEIDQVRDTVLDAERRRLRAMTERDLFALDRLLADDLSYVHSTGAIMSKRAYLDHVADETFLYGPIEAFEVETYVLANAVILIQRNKASIEKAGRRIDLELVVQTVWQGDGERWQLVTSISSPIRQPGADAPKGQNDA